MRTINREQILSHFSYEEFIPVLRNAFLQDTTTPARAHHEAGNTTLLLMPAWNERHLGVKTVTVAPDNRERNLPSVHANYTLFDRITGVPLAQLDGATITTLRTAAASAVAADILAPPTASRLLMIGHGSLATCLIQAHASVRPIREVRVRGRDANNVRAWCDANNFDDITVTPSNNLEQDIREFADIISCATTAASPVFPGHACRANQHIDLVGSYQKHTREADDDLMARAHVLLDTEMAAIESGDIAIPRDSGTLTEDRILGTIADALNNNTPPLPEDAITVFKSVGVAFEDLALAEFINERIDHRNDIA